MMSTFASSPARLRPGADFWLVGSVAALLVIGVQMVYSSSVIVAHNEFKDEAYFLVRQVGWLILGVIAATIAARTDYRIWRRLSIVGMAVCLVLLVVVLMPNLGMTAYGAQRWLKIGAIPLGQPSEFAKLFLVLYMADWLSRKGDQVRHFTYGSLPFAIIVGLVASLVMLQPDLGTTLVLILTAVSIFYLAGANLIHLVLMAIPATVMIGFLVLGVGWRADRVDAFLNPEADPLGKGWHTMQTLIALGSGGLAGVGLGESTQKHYYVPNAHTDTIFAILGEELGLLGTLAVLILFAIVAWRGLRIASRTDDHFGRLLAAGMTGKIIWQAILNMLVITNTVPYTGVPLPLISYGASSLVVTMVSIGMIFSVARFGENPTSNTISTEPSPRRSIQPSTAVARTRIRQHRARFRHAN